MNVSQGIVCVLAAGVFVSALAVVATKYQSRQHFVELEALKAEREALDIEWGKLTLEQATLVTPTRVERIARDRLGMTLPPAEQIVIVRP